MKIPLVVALSGLGLVLAYSAEEPKVFVAPTPPPAAAVPNTNAGASSSDAPAATPAPPPSEPAKPSAAELEKLAMPSRDRDHDGVLEYAQKIASSPGQTDGLYWPPDLNGEISPLGPLIADAQSEGCFGKNAAADAGPQPFHGYLFKILKRQGKHAPGGAYNYVINGNMIGGFGLMALPVEYGHTGIMTFIVNQQGRVYQKDLGGKTSRIATKMSAYDPDNSWRPSPD